MATPMLRLVSHPQQLSRLLQQRHTRFLRSHRRHSLQRHIRMRMNPTTVVGEASCSGLLHPTRSWHRTRCSASHLLILRVGFVTVPFTCSQLHTSAPTATGSCIIHCICSIPLSQSMKKKTDVTMYMLLDTLRGSEGFANRSSRAQVIELRAGIN